MSLLGKFWLLLGDLGLRVHLLGIWRIHSTYNRRPRDILLNSFDHLLGLTGHWSWLWWLTSLQVCWWRFQLLLYFGNFVLVNFRRALNIDKLLLLILLLKRLRLRRTSNLLWVSLIVEWLSLGPMNSCLMLKVLNSVLIWFDGMLDISVLLVRGILLAGCQRWAHYWRRAHHLILSHGR